MTRTDIPLFGGQLNALAEVFGKTPVTVKAMEVWFDALKEFPAERVMDVLNSWAKFNGRFPMPAQVVEKVNNTMTDNREKKAAFERAQNKDPTAREYIAPSPQTRRLLAEMRKLLGTKTPPQAIEREPGEDDEPALGIPLDDFERELGERANP